MSEETDKDNSLIPYTSVANEEIEDAPGMFESVGRGAADQVLMSLGDEAVALGDSVITGKDPIQAMKEQEIRDEQAQEYNPTAYTLGQGLGLAAEVFMTLGGSSLIKLFGKNSAKKMINEFKKKGIKEVSKDVGKGAALGGVGGGLGSLGRAKQDEDIEDVISTAKDEAITGMKYGAGITGGIKVGGSILKGGKQIGVQAITGLSSEHQETISELSHLVKQRFGSDEVADQLAKSLSETSAKAAKQSSEAAKLLSKDPNKGVKVGDIVNVIKESMVELKVSDPTLGGKTQTAFKKGQDLIDRITN